MKKQLLAGAFVLASFLSVKAQVLQSENFDALTVGNVGTDITGATAGQGDFFTATNIGDDSDFQIVANGDTGNGLQITGAADAAGTTQATDNTKYIWKNGLNEAWSTRTDGKDIITAKFKFYTGAIVSGSTNSQRAIIYGANADATVVNTIGGFAYNPGTGELRGLATYTANNQTGLYNFALSSASTGAILEANTWYTVAVTVVPETGEILWSSNDITVSYQDGTTGVLSAGVTSADNAGLEPVEFDFVAFAGTANTASSSIIYDDVVIRAIDAEDDILANNPVAIAVQFSVFPNPANDVVNVSVDASINNISVTDLNGRTVKTVKFAGVAEAQVNVSDLASGIYMMTISSDKGATTKKIVKN